MSISSLSSFWYDPQQIRKAITSAQEKDLGILILVQAKKAVDFEAVLSQDKIASYLENKFSCMRLVEGEFSFGQFNDLVPIDRIPSLFLFYDGELRETINDSGIEQDDLLLHLEAVFDPSKKDLLKKKEPSLSDKKAMILERLEEKKRLKAMQEVERRKFKEVERRQSTKELQEAQIAKQERDAKILIETKTREKREAAEHRLKVQAQIAQDKADRAALRQKKEVEPKESYSPKADNKTFSNNSDCRLSLRMEDGSQHRVTFDADAALQEVREHVTNKLLDGNSAFDLMLTVPRYKFSVEDTSRTLRQLGLGSSNTLLIKLHKSSLSGAAANDMISSLANWGISSIQQLVVYLSSFIFPSNPRGTIQANSRTASSSRATGSNLRTIHDQSSDGKSETNVTDNGNSTQQQ